MSTFLQGSVLDLPNQANLQKIPGLNKCRLSYPTHSGMFQRGTELFLLRRPYWCNIRVLPPYTQFDYDLVDTSRVRKASGNLHPESQRKIPALTQGNFHSPSRVEMSLGGIRWAQQTPPERSFQEILDNNHPEKSIQPWDYRFPGGMGFEIENRLGPHSGHYQKPYIQIAPQVVEKLQFGRGCRKWTIHSLRIFQDRQGYNFPAPPLVGSFQQGN